MSTKQKENSLFLTNQEIKKINQLVEPFVQNELNHGHPTATGTTDRGVVITLQDATKILVRVYRHGETIPKAQIKRWFRECQECGHRQAAHKPSDSRPLTASYENSKCHKCQSTALDRGRMIGEDQDTSWD